MPHSPELSGDSTFWEITKDKPRDYEKAYFQQDTDNLNDILSQYGMSVEFGEDKKSFKINYLKNGKIQQYQGTYEQLARPED